MALPLERIEAEALALSAEERAQLASRLLRSLDDEEDDPAEVERAWEEEIEHRLAEYRAGRLKARPASQVVAEARARLRRE